MIAFTTVRILFFCLLITTLSADQFFKDKTGQTVTLKVAKSLKEIDYYASQDLMVRAFLEAYEEVDYIYLNPHFRTQKDLASFYKDFFRSEIKQFLKGELIWLQAYMEGKLIAWATFEIEKYDKNAAYLNLLAVAPEYQNRGVGRYLVFAITELFPNVRKINLFVRRINYKGQKFYQKLGFKESNYTRWFPLDRSLWMSFTWNKSP